MSLFISRLWTDPIFFVVWCLVLMFSICLHEYSHAWAALRGGDSTARDLGFLSMNPLRVMGVQSLVCMVLFGLVWGRVPISPGRFRSRGALSLACFAGPLSNLVLAFVFANLMIAMTRVSFLSWFFMIAALVNCFLFLFNILPIPGLDGWGVLEPLVPAMARIQPQTRSIILFAAIILLFATPVFSHLWNIASAMTTILSLPARLLF